MKGYEKGDPVKYKNALGEVRDGVVLKENKTTVRLLDGFKVLSIQKKNILEG